MFSRSRKIEGNRKSRKKIFPRSRIFLETPGNIGQRTHQIVQGTGVKPVAPTAVQNWARDLDSDYRYYGRQQEAPPDARTRLLYSAIASNDEVNGKSLNWMGPTREGWCCTRGLVSRPDMNTCQTSINTDILFSAAVTHPGSIGRTQDHHSWFPPN